jgi:hypothetical protein
VKFTDKLYSEQQKKEDVIFLEWRFLLAQRLVPKRKESDIAHLLLDNLKPIIRQYLRGICFDTLDELLALVEKDHGSIQLTNDRRVATS